MTADRVRMCIPRSGIPTANSLPRAQSTRISRFGIFGASRAFRRTRATPEVCGRSPSLPMGAGSSRAATMVWSSCGISRRAGERDAHADECPRSALNNLADFSYLRRLVHEFAPHSAPISGLAMHPTEFLMASASVDRTLRLWDLESFEQVCCMPPDSGQIRRVMFSEDGSALLSGAEESLRVWGWEPVRCYEQTDVRWSRLADLCTSPGQQKLLAGSVREAIVSVWNIDLTAIQPFASATHPAEQRQPPVRSPRPAAASPMGGRRVQSDATPPPAQRTAQTQRLDAPEPAATPAQKRDASRGMGNPDEAVRQQIAQCRAQLAQRRASQGQGATAPSHLSHCPTSCASASIAEAPPPEAFSASGNHASVGTSMTDTLDGRAPAVNPDGLLTAPPPSKPQHRAPAEAKRGADMCGDDHDILRLLTHGNERQEACLHSRLDALRTLHTFWQAGQVKQVQTRAPSRV